MRCNEAQDILDDYLDEDLATRTRRELESHVAHCDGCQHDLDERRALRVGLARLPVAQPTEEFFERVIANAVQARTRRRSDKSGPRRARPHWATRGFALAAAVACAFVLAVAYDRASFDAPFTNVPEATIALHEVTPVSLVFWTDGALEDARLSLQLPQGIELAGYANRTNLTWNTDLEPGRNLLRLPLVGHVAKADEVTATLAHPQGTKTFRLKITVI